MGKHKMYQGKTAVFVGDSITFGLGLQKGEKTYWKILKDTLGFSCVIGCGVSGSCVSNKSLFSVEPPNLIQRLKDIPSGDITLLLMGVNDYNFDTPIGEISQEEDVSYYGAWNVVLKQLTQEKKHGKIVLITLAPHCRPVENEVGLTAEDYIAPIWQLGEKFNLPVMDLNAMLKADFTLKNKDKYLPDGLHPNQEGQLLIAQKIQQWMEENADKILGK